MSPDAVTALKLRVEGMDCAACALKIENGLKRLPGVTEINVNVSLERCSLLVDEDRTSRGAVEQRIRSLGYIPHPIEVGGLDSAAVQRRGPDTNVRVWWQTSKGQLVLGSGVLLVVASVVGSLATPAAPWAYTAAALLALFPIVRRAIAGVRYGTPFSIETLMSVAALGAIAIGQSAEAAVVVFLFAVGELLENVAARRARGGIEGLLKLVPRIARREHDGAVTEVPIDDLVVGDTVVIRPGDRMPSDGEVIEGMSEVDEAPVTGESVPVLKQACSSIYAGSINGNGVLRVRITRSAADNTIARIIHLVEEAQNTKAPTARFIDRFSRFYTPAAMAFAALVMVLPPAVFGEPWSTWIYRGLATLLIACPCALVISTPAAIASGLAVGARHGLLIKGGAALETLGKVRCVAFDKTGTLTVGRPRLTDIIAVEDSEDEALAKAAAVEEGSSHPLGRAILEAADQRCLKRPKIFGGAIAVPGKAVTARLREGFVSVGSPAYASEQGAMLPEIQRTLDALESEGKTAVVVFSGKRTLGVIALRDEPRDDAAAGVADLHALGIRTVMLTGDNPRTAAAIANRLGLESRAELLPDAKLAEIGALKAHGGIAMVGDGINDAPALAASSVGVAMGGATDVALETADVALLNNRVAGVAQLIRLSRTTLRNIWQNISLALGLKGVFLITTLTGETSLWMAILADTGATVLVTINALRLLRFDTERA